MTEISIAVVSFLGGALISAVAFSFAFIGRIARIEATLAALVTTVDHIKSSRNICPLHSELVERVTRNEEKISAQR